MEDTKEFIDTIWDYYSREARDLPWRTADADGRFDPYKILVSEIMLQQTGVTRVLPKYLAFIKRFPDIKSLAAAPLADVLLLWSGLGYNRRARYVQLTARILLDTKEEWQEDQLVECPGIGINTARAIITYAYNKPTVFIETNVRTAIIAHFFKNSEEVTDAEVRLKLSEVISLLGADEYREFYWGIMDYGSYLKSKGANHSRQSKHYKKQASFKGSRRYVRGMIIKLLTNGPLSITSIAAELQDERVPDVIASLVSEGLVTVKEDTARLGS